MLAIVGGMTLQDLLKRHGITRIKDFAERAELSGSTEFRCVAVGDRSFASIWRTALLDRDQALCSAHARLDIPPALRASAMMVSDFGMVALWRYPWSIQPWMVSTLLMAAADCLIAQP